MESKLRSVLRSLVKYEECVETLEENEKAQEALKAELKRLLEARKSYGRPVLWIFLLVIGVVSLIVFWPVGICLIIASPISYVSSCNNRNYPVYKYRTTIYDPGMERLKADVEAISAEKEDLWENFCNEATFLPIRYHESFAIAHMIVSLKRGDATNLEEAIELYDKEFLSVGHDVLERYRDHYISMALE